MGINDHVVRTPAVTSSAVPTGTSGPDVTAAAIGRKAKSRRRGIIMSTRWLKVSLVVGAVGLLLGSCSARSTSSSSSQVRSTTASSTNVPSTTIPVTSNPTHPSPTESTEPTEPTERITDVAFFNPEKGYGVFTRQDGAGCQDLVGPTTNGGVTFGPLVTVSLWICAKGDSANTLAFDDHGDGFLYGPGLYVTHNGGKTWSRNTQPGAVLSVEALGSSVWMVQARCPTSTVRACPLQLLESNDGGRTWSSSAAPASALSNPYVDEAQGQTWLVRINQSSAYLLSNPVTNPEGDADQAPLWFTADSGRSWFTRSIPCKIDGQSVVLSAAPDGTLIAVCAGEPGAGEQMKSVLRSFNSGITWTVESYCPLIGSAAEASCASETLNSGYLSEIDVVSANTVYLVGNRSALLVSRDGGASWQVVPSIGDTSDGTQRVIFFNGLAGLVFGFDPNKSDLPTLWVTRDGGTKWTAVVPQPE